MKKPTAPDWTIAGLGPLLALACAGAMLLGAPPDAVLAALGIAVIVLVIVAEFST